MSGLTELRPLSEQVWDYDYLDFPTGWRIQRECQLEHDARCSSVPGWDPISGPHFLCDCGALEREFQRLRLIARTPDTGGKP